MLVQPMHVYKLWTIPELSAVSNNYSLIHCGSFQRWRKFNTCSNDSNACLFYVSLAGLGLVTARLDYNNAVNKRLDRQNKHHRTSVEHTINVLPVHWTIYTERHSASQCNKLPIVVNSASCKNMLITLNVWLMIAMWLHDFWWSINGSNYYAQQWLANVNCSKLLH